MGWSTEVHDSRVTSAVLQAKHEARLRRAHKLPEPQGNTGPWPLAAVAGLLLSAVALQQDGNWRHATSKLTQILRQLPWSQKPQQVCQSCHQLPLSGIFHQHVHLPCDNLPDTATPQRGVLLLYTNACGKQATAALSGF